MRRKGIKRQRLVDNPDLFAHSSTSTDSKYSQNQQVDRQQTSVLLTSTTSYTETSGSFIGGFDVEVVGQNDEMQMVRENSTINQSIPETVGPAKLFASHYCNDPQEINFELAMLA
ncbi:unnamed protein product, partial [Allacma fusca]